MAWMNRLWNVIRSRDLDRELDEELRFHLEARIRDNIKAGMSPGEAREDAIRRFGNRTLAKELTRETDVFASIETAGRDLRYAFRSLRKSPGFTVPAILVIALGIGANTAVFAVVNGVLLRPLPFPEPDRLFLISYAPKQSFFLGPSADKLPRNANLADHRYLEFRRKDRQFESIASFAMNPVTLTRAGDPLRLTAAVVTPDFLRVLHVDPVVGRGFLSDEGEPGRNTVVVLGDKLWRSRFGGHPAVAGTTITLDGIRHTVIGIMPPGFAFPAGAELWMPMEIRLQPGNSFSRPVVGRLKAGVSREQAQDALEAFAEALPLGAHENRSNFEARIYPLKDAIVAGIRESLLVFAGAVAFVLLIACANVANLLLIRAASRRHEITMRAALGASRWRLIRQLLTESMLVAVTGGAGGLLLAVVGVPALLALAPAGKIPRADEIGLDPWVLAFTFAVSVLTGIVFGLAPALRATRRDLRRSLAEGGRTSTGRSETLRSALVVSEIALALVLLTGAGLLLKSFWRIHSVDPGFRPENVLAVTIDLPGSHYRTPAQMRAFHQSTLEKLSSLPGIETAGAVNWMPLGGNLIRGDFKLEGGRERPRGYMVDKPVVSPGYFRAMGIRLLRGRAFSERDNAAAPGVVVVSNSVARALWPGEDPIGKRIAMQERPKPEDWLTVVGVVDDIRQQQLTAKPSPAIYQPYLQVNHTFFLSHMTFVVRTASSPGAVAPAIRGIIQGVDADQPVQSIATMGDVIAGTTAEPRFRTRLIGAFSIMAVLLSAIGIYGVLACSIAERTHEIGIRMAIGASKGSIVRMVLHRTLLLVATGVALGTAGALAVTRVLENFLFEVRPADPATYVAVATLLGAVALFAGLLPARRASTVDPLVALRYE